MLRSTHAHALVVLALLTPLLACGDDSTSGSGSGGQGSTGGSSQPDDEDICLPRDQLVADIQASESTTGATAATTATTGGQGAGGAGVGGAGEGGAGGGGEPAATCPAASHAEPFVEAKATPTPGGYYDQVGDPRATGDDCCYVVHYEYGASGRPVRIDDALTVPSLRRAPAIGAPPAAPAAVPRFWEWAGRLEHASVASFALLSLDLVAHGAPLDLVTDAHRAALDEVRHAQLVFDHASRFGGSPISAGEMPGLAACRISPDVDALVASTLRDGCINETFASFEAAEQAVRCADAALAADLAVIAIDEARHAALGWRIVAWAVRSGRVAPERVARLLRDGIRELRASRSAAPEGLEAHGILGSATRDALVADVARRIEQIGALVLERAESAHAA